MARLRAWCGRVSHLLQVQQVAVANRIRSPLSHQTRLGVGREQADLILGCSLMILSFEANGSAQTASDHTQNAIALLGGDNCHGRLNGPCSTPCKTWRYCSTSVHFALGSTWVFVGLKVVLGIGQIRRDRKSAKSVSFPIFIASVGSSLIKPF
jgi:hypothetical protein